MLLWLLLLACDGRDPVGTDDTHGTDTDDTDTEDTNDTDDSDTEDTDEPPPDPELLAPAVVALPYAVAGSPVASAGLELRATGVTDPLTATVVGPFAVTGDLGTLGEGEVRTLTVEWTGGSGPVNAVGSVAVQAGELRVDVLLSAVLGDPALPSAVSWVADDHGRHTVVDLPSAPYPEPGGAWTDPSVLLWVPDGLSVDAPVGAITHLHGYGVVLEDMVASKHLLELAAVGGRDAVLIIPQGPVDAASGDFGRLMEPGGHAALVRDAFALLYREGSVRVPVVEGQVLTAHSGGYLATAAILGDGPVDAVHLFDALYGQYAVFADLPDQGTLLRSSYTTSGGTLSLNQTLAAELTGDGVDVGDTFSDHALAEQPVLIGHSPLSHSQVMADERAFGRWLVESGLPPHRDASPELRSVLSDGVTAQVRWRVERGAVGLLAVVEGSDDGSAWSELATSSTGSAAVPARAWIRARWLHDGVPSAPSDVYAGSGDAWLVVDGFDRVIGGSWTQLTHAWAATVAAALPSASTASHQAVAGGDVRLTDYDRVLWLLGDDSTADRTLDAAERAAVEGYLDAGGALVISGAELGYATDGSWLLGTLGVRYVEDDAGTTSAGGYTFGVGYPEDYPDVLASDVTVWSYATGGGAAVGTSNRQVLAVGFPVETLHPDDMDAAVGELAAWVR